jgi:dinuclear metal center YbgI/SA1388 family protein
MKIKEIINYLEKLANPQLQENYDNCGLITGNYLMEISSAIVCLDATEMVIDEAIKKGANLVIAHHPIVFKGLKTFTGKNYVERTILKAIKNNIAIYAIHTNLDNVLEGVNNIILNKLGATGLKILSPKKNTLLKLQTFVPNNSAEKVRNALFSAGAGNIGNYSEASFNTSGTGTFKGNEFSNPKIGKQSVREDVEEVKIETIFPFYLQSKILEALFEAHPYE